MTRHFQLPIGKRVYRPQHLRLMQMHESAFLWPMVRQCHKCCHLQDYSGYTGMDRAQLQPRSQAICMFQSHCAAECCARIEQTLCVLIYAPRLVQVVGTQYADLECFHCHGIGHSRVANPFSESCLLVNHTGQTLHRPCSKDLACTASGAQTTAMQLAHLFAFAVRPLIN